MRVFGVDCGIAITGWAVLESLRRSRGTQTYKVIDYGVVCTDSKLNMTERLEKLYNEVRKKLLEFKPDSVAVESLFYFKNQKTIISVGQARGVILLAAAKRNIEVFDYTPLQVKQAITGYGKATKDQMQRMTKTILKLKEIPKPDDAADALAIGVCHLNTISFLRRKRIPK